MKIIFTKQVIFSNQLGEVIKIYNIGDIIPYTSIVDNLYFVTSMGGIWFDEAKII